MRTVQAWVSVELAQPALAQCGRGGTAGLYRGAVSLEALHWTGAQVRRIFIGFVNSIMYDALRRWVLLHL